MVMRDRFDHFLAMKAQNAGAELRTGERVVDVAETGDDVRVRTREREYRAQYLVGADGANGVVGRALGITPRRRVAVCVEAEVTTDARAPEMPADEVRIEFGAIPFGYGWVFPKGDHLSIGVGGLRPKIGNPRALYDEFLVDQDMVDALVTESRKGYIIPVFAGGRDPIHTQRTVMLGDAAAFSDSASTSLTESCWPTADRSMFAPPRGTAPLSPFTCRGRRRPARRRTARRMPAHSEPELRWPDAKQHPRQ